MTHHSFTLLFLVAASAAAAQTYTEVDGVRYRLTADASVQTKAGEPLDPDKADQSSQLINAALLTGPLAEVVAASSGSYQQEEIAIAASVTHDGTTYPVRLVADNAFKDAAATTITLPEGVVQIGKDAFENCVNLTSFIIPSSVTYMAGSPFKGCRKLAYIAHLADNDTYDLGLDDEADPYHFNDFAGAKTVIIVNPRNRQFGTSRAALFAHANGCHAYSTAGPGRYPASRVNANTIEATLPLVNIRGSRLAETVTNEDLYQNAQPAPIAYDDNQYELWTGNGDGAQWLGQDIVVSGDGATLMGLAEANIGRRQTQTLALSVAFGGKTYQCQSEVTYLPVRGYTTLAAWPAQTTARVDDVVELPEAINGTASFTVATADLAAVSEGKMTMLVPGRATVTAALTPATGYAVQEGYDPGSYQITIDKRLPDLDWSAAQTFLDNRTLHKGDIIRLPVATASVAVTYASSENLIAQTSDVSDGYLPVTLRNQGEVDLVASTEATSLMEAGRQTLHLLIGAEREVATLAGGWPEWMDEPHRGETYVLPTSDGGTVQWSLRTVSLSYGTELARLSRNDEGDQLLELLGEGQLELSYRIDPDDDHAEGIGKKTLFVGIPLAPLGIDAGELANLLSQPHRVGDDPFTLHVDNATTGGTVTVERSTGDAISVDYADGVATIHFVRTGEATLDVSKPGNNDYANNTKRITVTVLPPLPLATLTWEHNLPAEPIAEETYETPVPQADGEVTVETSDNVTLTKLADQWQFVFHRGAQVGKQPATITVRVPGASDGSSLPNAKVAALTNVKPARKDSQLAWDPFPGEATHEVTAGAAVALLNGATNAAGAKLTYSSTNEEVAQVTTLSGGRVKVTYGVGGQAWLVVHADPTDTYKAAEVRVAVRVKLQESDLYWDPGVDRDGEHPVSDEPVMLNAASGTGAITYTSSDPAVATVDVQGGRPAVTFVGLGRVTITASAAGDPMTTEPGEKSIALVGVKAPSDLHWRTSDLVQSKPWTTGTAVTLNPAQCADGSNITYASSDESILLVRPTDTGVRITFLGPGEATVQCRSEGTALVKPGLVEVTVQAEGDLITIDDPRHPDYRAPGAIRVVEAAGPAKTDQWHDLAGRPIDRPDKPGLYIRNGRLGLYR